MTAAKPLPPQKTSDVKGVRFHALSGGWVAYISIKGSRYQKVFRTKEAAVAQRQRWEALKAVELGL